MSIFRPKFKDAKTGEVSWKLPLGPFQTDGYLSASPILAGDKVIMVCDVAATDDLQAHIETGGEL